MWNLQTICNHRGISLVEVVGVLVITSIPGFMDSPDAEYKLQDKDENYQS